MTDALFSAVEVELPNVRAGYRLHHLEVYNWGTFDARPWRLTVGADTALLTGDIGSGKSTLVDALTTLLLPAHRIAYNKAAGADSRERTLRSYVEGYFKSERVDETSRSRPVGLRTDKQTYSVILGVFTNEGYGETVTLAEVFQQRDATGQPYRFYAIAPRGLAIREDFAGFGDSLNDLRKRLRDHGVEVFDDFKKYDTSFRRLLGIRSPQALELFHQTVSMKSVGNLNEFVRDHMLEPADAAGRISEIIQHFEDLTKAHDAVKRAREQLDALAPVVAAAGKYDAAQAERAELERQRGAVRLFVAESRSQLLGQEIAQLEAEIERGESEQAEARRRLDVLAGEHDSLIAEQAREGGNRISELERLAREARQQGAERAQRRSSFDAAVAAAGLAPVGDAAAFGALAATVEQSRPRLDARRGELDARKNDLIGSTRELAAQVGQIRSELGSLARRTSNLPREQVGLREQLCADLKLRPEQLPYAGELLDVAEGSAEWRGAAERVLRGFALSLLVPGELYEAVAGWVDARRLAYRDNGAERGAKLVYERVSARRVPLRRQADDELTLADCLEVKEGPFRDYLLDELAKRADFRCADTLEEFRATRRAVTRQGQVRSGERHEKDDRYRVDDPRRWVLGWANQRKIAALGEELAELEGRHREATAELAALAGELEQLSRITQALAIVSTFQSWSDLDVAEAEARAGQADADRARLESGASRLQEIRQALDRNDQQSKQEQAGIEQLISDVAMWAARKRQALDDQRRDQELIDSVAGEELALARESYEALADRLEVALRSAADCPTAESRLSEDLTGRISARSSDLTRYGNILAAAMNEVLRRWPELSAEMSANADSRGEFLAFHQRVADDDLPRFEAEFKRQLNLNTINELAQFNAWLRRQADDIDDRVARINEALGAIPYNPGRYIKLEKQPTTHSEVIEFRSELRRATDDTLSGDDDHYSEQRFLEVKRLIERFRGREGYADADRAWTRRVTDVRNWFVFSASERDLETHQEWEHYSDSDGKSGGQKEKLAYTILAASLAYQFGLEWAVARSKDFRFAVIDEAFSRGSDASTRYALDLFAKLGLQLLIVTPLQKVHVIEPYVRAIGFVDNPDGTSSRLQTMTIEEYRDRRDGVRP